MPRDFRQADLEAYLDEALPSEEMARIEKALRDDPKLLEEVVAINSQRDAGVHSLGEIWRRHRLSCLSREQLGGFLLGTLSKECADYVAFHLNVAGCRYCQANMADLERLQAEAADAAHVRRRKYFQSSAGYLRRGSPKSK
jgi:anti-sigma factor RsiW